MVNFRSRRKLASSRTQISPASSAGQQHSPENVSSHTPLRHSRRLHPTNDGLFVKREILEHSKNPDIIPQTRAKKDSLATKQTAPNLSENKGIPTRRSLRSVGQVEPDLKLGREDGSSHEEEGHEERRRSSRQKKVMYNSYNEAAITPLYPVRRSKEKMNDMSVQPEVETNGVGADMYTIVKRTRRKIKRDMYGMPLVEEEEKSTEEETEQERTGSEDDENTGSEDDENTGSEDDEGAKDEENDDEEEEDETPGQYNLRHRRFRTKAKSTAAKYNLRLNKPRTKLYEATIEKRPTHLNYFKMTSPKRYQQSSEITFKSPAHRHHRRKRASHRTSSTSSSGSESEDERRFSRRKNKSMAKARQRCLPMNLIQSDLTHTMKDRQRIGASLADIDPMSIDRSVTFDSIGGLTEHVQALKEMIVFPLLYPEVFERFKISPPRGVLFHGPPGTGKTLVARALANECSTGEKKVAFFMRKGADCLSKWVGESERQLRLLFDQAYQVRPSIIFFDEIDGLAPVRSSRQDQIHSSIVSTLLALMDGLDSRGEVVVIGATNRIDSIDPALRRPGRFDREFLFNLPPVQARAEILRIHTKEWNPQLLDRFIVEVASKCNGYCGADLKALCTEAALHALRRRYPQIYNSKDKLQLDVTSIDISAADFHHAISKIVPAGQRAVVSPGRPLSAVIKPILKNQFDTLVSMLSSTFPFITQHETTCATTHLLESIVTDSSTIPVTECFKGKRKSKQEVDSDLFLDFTIAAYSRPIISRPRMLLHGSSGNGVSAHLAPAILHHMEKVPVHLLDLPTLYANSAKTAEEACSQVFREARRSTPSVIYIPQIDKWWRVLSDTMQATFLMLLNDMDPLLPILLLATSDNSPYTLPTEIRGLFSLHSKEVYEVRKPTEGEVRVFFEDLLLHQTCVPPARKKQAAHNLLEELPKAPITKPTLTAIEEKALWEQEESILRELRLFLRDMLNKLSRDRKFNIFSKPVDDEEVPDYYEIIKTPMDLSKMMSKIDLHQYQACKEFLDDIDLICANALEYNPADSVAGRAIRHRACALKDTAHALIDNELDEDFEKQCKEIVESRCGRGLTPTKAAPKYYHTKSIVTPLASSAVRYSKRLRNEEADSHPASSSNQASNQRLGRASHDITQDDIHSPPRKKRKKSRWALGFSHKHKKSRRRANVEEESEEAESKHDETEEPNGAISDEANGKENAMGSQADKQEQGGLIEVSQNSNNTASHSSRSSSSDEVPLVNGLNTSTVDGQIPSSPETENTSPETEDTVNVSTDIVETSSTLCKLENNDKEDPDTISNDIDHVVASPSHHIDNNTPSECPKENGEVPSLANVSGMTEEEDISHEGATDSIQMKAVDSSKSNTPPNPQAGSHGDSSVVSTPLIKEKVLEVELEVSMAKRKTRSMTSDQQLNKCWQIVEEPIPAFNIDETQLPLLLDAAVNVGQHCSLVELEKLYSLLAQRVYHHRASYDRSLLLQELRDVLNEYVRIQS